MKRFSCLCVLASLCFFIVATAIVVADTMTGEVRGGVIDTETKNSLPAVSMKLQNVDQGWTKQGQTDADGNYVFLQLEPGAYTLVAEKTDYYPHEEKGIRVRLNQPRVVIPPIALRKTVSTPTQQITVQGEQTKIALIDLTSPGPNQTVLAYLSETGLTSMVALGDSSVRSNYDDSLVHALPLRGGRSFDQLSLFSPGVFRVPASSGEGPAVGIGVGATGQFSVNGLRSRSNNFTVDGSDNNDEDIGVRRQGFVSLTPQSIESVKEFQIMTAGFPAEFGRNSGSMVNAVSRSGENDIHGNVYGFFNPNAWNASNPFEHPFRDTINAAKLSGGQFTGNDYFHAQYGGVAGGPIIPKKLFYFGSLEGQNTHGGVMRHFVVPSENERGLRTRNGLVKAGDLDDFFDIRNIAYSAAAGRGVFSLYPLPNDPGGPFDSHDYAQVKRHEARGAIASSKLDWYITPVHSFAARYNFTDDDSVLPFTGDAINSSLANNTRTQNLSLFLNSTKPNFGNAARVSFGRTRLRFPQDKSSPFLFGSAPASGLPPSVASAITTRDGTYGPFGVTGAIGQLSILPYSSIGIDVFNFPQGRVDNTFQIADAVTWTRSKHALKTGVEIRRSQLNSFADRNSRPLLIFGNGVVSDVCVTNSQCVFGTPDGILRGTDLAALGAPAAFLQTISTNAQADTTIGLRFTHYNFFVQDDWKPFRKLTVNAGLRYELNTVPVEVNERIERTFHLDPQQFGHMQTQGATAQNASIIRAGNRAFDAALQALSGFLNGRSEIYDPENKNFAPRIGMAWDPSGNGKTAIRAGYSLSYDAHLGAVTSQSRNVFPTFVPLNLDLNFLKPPDNILPGSFINGPAFLTFIPTQQPLIRPGTLNVYNLGGDAFATGLGTLFAQTQPAPGLNLSSNGLAFTLPERAFETGYAQHFMASVEHQFGDNYLASIHSVVTRGLHLPRFVTPNAGLVSTPFLSSSNANPLTLLDFPPGVPQTQDHRRFGDLGAFTLFQDSATSDYDSLQLAFEKRLSRGYQFRANWTWSHAIDQVSDPFDGRSFFSLPQDGARLDLERASANFDVRHRLTGFFVWKIPGIAGKRIFSNWTLATTGEFQTGQPFTVNTTFDRNGDGNLTDRLNSLEGIEVRPGQAQSILLSQRGPALAPLNSDGRISRNSFRAQGISSIDMALSRSFVLKTKTLDLRMETFNLFNRTNYGIPVRLLESPGFGRSFDTQLNPRSMRLSLKLSF